MMDAFQVSMTLLPAMQNECAIVLLLGAPSHLLPKEQNTAYQGNAYRKKTK
jgi:hypothetical protein